MSSVQHLRALINQRLTAAAEEILTEFEKTIVQYEEEIDRQRRLLEISWRAAGRIHTTDLPQQHVHEENSPPEHPQIEEEQEELCTNQERDQLVVIQGANVLLQCKSKCEKPSREIFQSNEEMGHQHRLLDIIWKPQIKLHRIDFPEQHVCKEEIVLNDQQLCNQKQNFSLDQNDPDPPQNKTEQEEHCSSLDHKDPEPTQNKTEQEGHCSSLDQNDPEPTQNKEEQEELSTSLDLEDPKPPQHKPVQMELCTSLDQNDPEPPQSKEELCISQLGEQITLKQMTDAFVLTSTDKDSVHSDLEPNSNQLFSYNSPVAESPHQEGNKHVNSGSTRNATLRPKKSRNRNSSHSNNVDDCSLSESHCDTDTGRKSVKCDVSGNTLKNKNQIKKRHQTHKGVKPFDCNACGKSFSFSSRLKAHMKMHTGEKPFSCKSCGKHFSRRRNLTEHMRTHTGEKPYFCETCGKSFHYYNSLTNHRKIHTGEKPFSCETCGKSFSLRHHLTFHMRSHTGERPHSCETCGKSFRKSNHLTFHMRTHTGEKPFSCETCGKSFSRSFSLRVHMRTHTGEKPYFCETCGKSFSASRSVTDHMRTHTGAKPYFCEKCGKSFRKSHHLTVHMRTHSSKTVVLKPGGNKPCKKTGSHSRLK